MIYEPSNRIDVKTPNGDGIIWLVTDYGHETDTIYTLSLIHISEPTRPY